MNHNSNRNCERKVTQKRDLAIDAARGVALFLVVLSHARHIPHYVTAFYIMAFFFLSGWLYKPGRSFIENIKKKAYRALVPYFVNSIILLLIYSAIKAFDYEFIKNSLFGIIYSRNVVEIGNAPIMITGNAPLWYLTSFFTTSLLFHLLVDKFSVNLKTTAIVCLTLMSVSIALATLPILFPWSLEMVPFFTVVMLLGCVSRNKLTCLDFNWLTTAVLFVGYVAVCFENGSINLSIRNFGGGNYGTLICGISGTLACISLCRKNKIMPLQCFFENVGTNSIVVLSYHIVLFSVYRPLLSIMLIHITGRDFENEFLYDLAIVLLSVLSCIGIGKLYEVIKNKVHIR